MTQPDGPIAEAALTALEEARAAREAAEQARRQQQATAARERVVALLEEQVDGTALTVEVFPDAQVAVVSDGSTSLAVDRERTVRLAEVRDGQPTALSEPLPSLAALGELLEGRGE